MHVERGIHFATLCSLSCDHAFISILQYRRFVLATDCYRWLWSAVGQDMFKPCITGGRDPCVYSRNMGIHTTWAFTQSMRRGLTPLCRTRPIGIGTPD